MTTTVYLQDQDVASNGISQTLNVLHSEDTACLKYYAKQWGISV